MLAALIDEALSRSTIQTDGVAVTFTVNRPKDFGSRRQAK